MTSRVPAVLPGMAVPIYFPNGHSLTAAEHQLLADAKVLDWSELDELARLHRDDDQVKRGNLQVLGPRPHPLAYVVGPHVLAIAPGLRDATHGGWVRPGGEESAGVLGLDARADVEAERDAERCRQMRDSALDWDERHALLGGVR